MVAKHAGVVLTARERDIVEGIERGLTNQQIADGLGLSEKTVRNQLTVLYEKFGVRGRLQLAVLLVSQTDLLKRK